jgi:hypothetical protein
VLVYGPALLKESFINMKTKFFISISCLLLTFSELSAQQRYLVFSNGYRGLDRDSITTSNEVFTVSPAGGMSPAGYWFDIDDTLISRFQPTTPLYIDGHHPVATSMHRTKGRSFWSWFVTRFGWVGHSNWGFNDEPNLEGFQTRYDNGRRCGERFTQSYVKSTTRDTLDVVCHSMGYAYALGFIEAVEPYMVLGKILILAPESPGVRGMDWNRFEEVWQYGSDRFEKGADITCRQDGVAPQCAVVGLEQLSPVKGGRLFIPKGAKKGFVRSHHLSYWNWFYDIKKGDRGWFGR